jgi:hypothetical protein
MLPLLIAVALVLSFSSRGAAWTEQVDMPAPSEGDVIFYVDVVTFYLEPGLNVEEIYSVVSNDQIEFVERDGGLRGDLKYEVEVLDENSNMVASSEKTI